MVHSLVDPIDPYPALKTLSSHVRAQDVPDVLYSEVVAGYGPELFYSRPIRLAGAHTVCAFVSSALCLQSLC